MRWMPQTRRERIIFLVGAMIAMVVCTIGSITVIYLNRPRVHFVSGPLAQTTHTLDDILGIMKQCDKVYAPDTKEHSTKWWLCVNNRLTILDKQVTQ